MKFFPTVPFVDKILSPIVSYFDFKRAADTHAKKSTFLLALVFLITNANAQLFSDNFNRSDNVVVGNGWTELETGTSGAQILSNRLQLGSTTAGREFLSKDASSLYTTNGLTSNTGLLIWAFNFKNTRLDPSGFDASNYGMAFILGSTSNTVTLGNGYAVVIGQSGTTDAIRLASFTNGPDANANFTTIISGNDYGNEFISVKVIYNSTTDEWSLYAESNASNFPQSNPALTSTQIGTTVVNTTYTAGNDLKYLGPFWNHATGASENAIFDDVSITITPISFYPRTTATDLSQASQWTDNITGVAGNSPTNFTSPNQLFNVNNNVANPVVASPWTISGGSNLVLNNTNTLTFTSAASFIVGTGSTADFNGKPVTLKSDATATAYIGTITGALSNASNVTVERYLSSNNNRAYRLLAPSVNTASAILSNWQENGSSAPNYGTHITGSTTGANGFDITQTGNPSLLVLDATQNYVPITNTDATNLNAKKGYLLYVRGDRTIDLSSTANPLPSSNTTLRATGTLLTGPQSFAAADGLLGNSSFSLVTNPYAAPVNWANVYGASTDLTQFYTLWDPNVGTEGGYVTVGATGPTAGVPSNAGSNANLHIQSGQAFFIQASGAPVPVVNIAEAHKSTTNNRDVFRVGTQAELFKSSLFYTNGAGTRINVDGVTSVYNNNYATTVDGDDAPQIPNWEEDIAIARNSKELSIESRPLIDVRDTILFAMARMQVRAYEWQFTASGFTHPDLSASLVDNFLNTKTPISLTGTTVIPFTVTANVSSSAANRFMVVFGPNTALPVNISAVKAYQKGKDIEVEWTAESETTLEKYEVEKSADARRFTKAATITARGVATATTYNWLDVNVANGSNYYRIKAISKSGEVLYSKVVRVNIGKTGNEITIYPNPVKGNFASLSVNLPKGKYTVTLTNKLGQQVYKKEMVHLGGSASQTLQFENGLAHGIYQLTISDGDNNYVQQMMKN